MAGVQTQSNIQTSEARKICPQFRILVLGNCGDGKSSLIKRVFGINDVDIRADGRGEADIDKELFTADKSFILHDTHGFESGENKTIIKVKEFIDDRRKKQRLQDQIHAVWVCVAVPYAYGRFLQAATEEILRDRKKLLGDIPVVVALTKVDLLDKMLYVKMGKDGHEVKTLEEAMEYIVPQKSQFLKENCSDPLLELLKTEIPHVPVAITDTGYGLDWTTSKLFEITTSEIERYIKRYGSSTSRG